MTATGDGDKALAEQAILRLYEQCEKERPAIIWCRSFYQMLTMPSLLFGLLHSDIWELFAGDMTTAASQDAWDDYWTGVWPQIWANGGQPLFTGMKRATRITDFYGYLEDTLIEHAKLEFGKAMRSGLTNMQQKLKREMYRRFWLPINPAQDFAKSAWVRLKHDVFERAGYVRQSHPEGPLWLTIRTEEHADDLEGEGVGRLFDLLALRLGGEPSAQGSFIMRLPASLPWLGTASLLAQMWPEEFAQQTDNVQMWLDLANNASGIMCLDGVAFVCERPTMFKRLQNLRLHSERGPALAYADGFEEYAWEGVLVPKFVIEEPESITVEIIEECSNAEVRRVMLDKYGTARYIVDAKVESVQEDECGILFRRELAGDEPLVIVKVINSTPEPDGTFKEYFLRVPPQTSTAKEGIAWTFGLDTDEYDPSVQT